MRTSLYTMIAVAMALPMLACQSTDDLEVIDGAGPMGALDFSIYNGSAPDAPEHDAVVALHQLTKQGQVYVSPFCTGTLITEDVVLTAAHCLNTGNASKVRTMKPSALAIYVGDEPAVDILDHLYFTTETLIHPGFHPYSLTDDIALVRLATAVTEPVVPVPALPAGLGWSNGETLNFAGFGEDESGASGVKLQGDGLLDGLGCTVNGCPDGGDPATQISYTQDLGSPCFGDSGGPAFVDRAGTIYVGGITSYGDANCLVYGVSTRADAYETFIGDFAGTTPLPPPPDCSADGWCNPECAEDEDPDCAPPPPPDCSADGWCNPECAEYEDPDCSTPPPDDCGDGVCGAGESCDGRDGTLSCPADCDGKTTGKPSGRYCYVEGVCEGGGCP